MPKAIRPMFQTPLNRKAAKCSHTALNMQLTDGF